MKVSLLDIAKKVSGIRYMVGSRFLLETSKKTKRRNGFVKMVIDEQMADDLLMDRVIPLFITIPREEFEKVFPKDGEANA